MQTNTLAADVIARLAAEPGRASTIQDLAQRCVRSADEVRAACDLLQEWRILGAYDESGVAASMERILPPRPIVLVVENTPAVAHVVGALLESEGYRVLIAGSLLVGQRIVELVQVSLVIADSFAATARLALERLNTLRTAAKPAPVLIFTAHRDIDDGAARGAGFAGLLPKPFDIDELLARVAETIHVASAK